MLASEQRKNIRSSFVVHSLLLTGEDKVHLRVLRGTSALNMICNLKIDYLGLPLQRADRQHTWQLLAGIFSAQKALASSS